ncbi:MAG: AAA domain-containing protein [Bacteroidia bacterium]
MPEIIQIGKYAIIRQLSERAHSWTFEVQHPESQKCFFCKVIKGLQPTEGAQRTFRDMARKLGRLNSPAINAPVDSGFDIELGHFFIVYPFLENQTSLESQIGKGPIVSKKEVLEIVQCWKILVHALSEAQSRRVFHKDIHPENIRIERDNQPVLIDFGLVDLARTLSKSGYELSHTVAFTAPEVIQKKEDPIEIRSDLYSLGLCMLNWMLGEDAFSADQNNERRLNDLGAVLVEALPLYPVNSLLEIVTKSIAINPRNRYPKYSDILVHLSSFQEALLIDRQFPAAVYLNEKPEFNLDDFFEELNEKGCMIHIDDEKYQDPGGFNPKAQVRFRLTTENFYAPKGFVEQNSLKLLYLKRRSELDEGNLRSYNFVRKNGIPLDFDFLQVNSINRYTDQWLDVATLFDHYFDEFSDRFSSVKLTERQKETLDFYTKLLEGELDYLRKNAFSVKYKEFSQKGSEITFKLDLPSNKHWKYVHDFIQKSTDPNREDVELIVPGTEEKNRRPISIGNAVRFSGKEMNLIVRDSGRGTEGIEFRNGELREDVSKQEVQFARQLKAIKAFKHGDFNNKDLCAYIFNPEMLPEDLPMLAELSKVISRGEGNKPLTLYDAQDRAVRKILFNDPITMIQGPPGTGKTTVIVEAIRQIVQIDPRAKILVTSQSNFAVDNVLQKLAKAKLPVIRLGNPDRIKQPSIKKFALNHSLRTWADRTMDSHRAQIGKLEKEANIDPALAFIYQELESGKDWNREIKPNIENAIERFKKHKDLLNKTSSRAVLEAAVGEKISNASEKGNLGPLMSISKDWTRLLSNLNEESDLVEKMVDSVNVIGATSNHIASGAYAKFEFDFDYVIMDEAAKATPAESLVPISMGKKIVLVGDHLQLRPIVTTNKQLLKDVSKEFKEELLENPDQTYLDEDHPSLFEMMFRGAPEDYVEALDIQRRMPEVVSDLISKYFYEPEPHNLKIKTAEEKKGQPVQIGMIRRPLYLLDTGTDNFHQKEKDSHSSFNEFNADIIIDLLLELDTIPGIEKLSIGVISGYGAQIRRIKNLFSSARRKNKFKSLILDEDIESAETGVSIATVDSFQGLEKDIIIFDIVRSHYQDHLAFLEIPNRINVAFSRVKQVLIVVGDVHNTIHAPRMNPNKDKSKAPIQLLIQEIHESGKTINSVKGVTHG